MLPLLHNRYVLFFGLVLLVMVEAAAEERWYVQTSVYTTHFNPKPEHVNRQNLIGLEYYPERDYLDRAGWMIGGATFQNSFGQRSTYLYGGRRFELPGEYLYGKLTGGVLHGWRGEHQDNIPLNNYGVAPAILPALGVQVGRFGGELVVFGLGGMMINFGARF